MKYVSTHVGHEVDIGHPRLSEKDRAGITAAILRKIPFQEIINEIRGTLTDSVLERKHLVTRQHLHNIEQCYNSYLGAVRHQNDAVSVDAWVHEVNSSEDPCVLFYKPQSRDIRLQQLCLGGVTSCVEVVSSFDELCCNMFVNLRHLTVVKQTDS